MKSLQKIMTVNPDVIYPGHGNVIQDPLKKIQFYIDHRNQRERQILKVLKENAPKTLSEMDIVHDVYENTPSKLIPAAAFNVNHHLLKLEKESRVRNVSGKWQYLA